MSISNTVSILHLVLLGKNVESEALVGYGGVSFLPSIYHINSK